MDKNNTTPFVKIVGLLVLGGIATKVFHVIVGNPGPGFATVVAREVVSNLDSKKIADGTVDQINKVVK